MDKNHETNKHKENNNDFSGQTITINADVRIRWKLLQRKTIE